MPEDFTARISADPQITMVAIGDLRPNPRNARTHSAQQIAKIRASIDQFGFMGALLIAEDKTIIAGHGRLEAARQAGLPEVPCIVASHLTEAQRRAYTLADNRLALDAGWDDDMLRLELGELGDLDFDMDLTGFDAAEIDALMAPTSGGRTDPDVIPEPPTIPLSQLGEVWILGKHRIRCGDSCDADGVSALLNGAKPHLMITDPPYGVEYDPAWRNRVVRENGTRVADRAVGQVMNDDNADWTKAWELSPASVCYVWHAGKFGGIVQESLELTGYEIRAQIIWNKNVFAIGRSDYHWKHEPCFYAVQKGQKAHYNGSRKESTVWDIDKPQKSETGHSTQKPVECMRRPMINNSVPGDAVYDPFLGSGTTLIAAEQEGRTCYGSELNPAYVDVIIKRWQDFTGKQAVRESDGAYFDNLVPAQVAA